MSDLYQSLAHSKWDCKYHVVFVPKRLRKVIFGNIPQQLGAIFHRDAEAANAWFSRRRNDRRDDWGLSRRHNAWQDVVSPSRLLSAATVSFDVSSHDRA